MKVLRDHGLRRFFCVLLAFAAAACTAPVRKKDPAVFFPPSPELPRIQYLTSFSGLRDIEEQSAFNRFVVGEKPDLRVDKPYGVAMHDGKIYVCDTNTSVAVFDLRKKTFGLLKGATGPGKLMQPISITVDPDGIKYVADPVRGQVVAFGADDEYLRAYGTPGNWRPVDAVALEERLYVADVGNGLIKVFDRTSGEMVKTIGNKGDPTERLDRPTNVAFDRDGYLYVSDAGRFQVVKFDRDGHFKAMFGKLGDNLGHFARPKGVAVDREGRLYAVDASFNNVQIFSPQGRLLMYFGGPGDAPGGMLLPAEVAVDYDNVELFEKYVEPGFRPEHLILVTSQFAERRVSIFAFGHAEGKTYPTDAELLELIDQRRKEAIEKLQPKPEAQPATQ